MSVDPMRKHAKWGELDPSTEVEGFGQVLWNVEAHKTCKTKLENGATTLWEALEKTKDKYREKQAVGWRNVVKVHEEPDSSGVKREKIQLENKYDWMSYGEYYDRVVNLARGLEQVGLKPKDKVVIYAETQRDWMVAAFAAFFSNAQVVTIYATLGEDGAIHGINETEAKIVVTDSKLLKIMAKVLPKCKTVKAVVALGEVDPTIKEKITAEKVELHFIENLIETGKTNMCNPQLPTPEDIAVIMYTSGTTGPPKGVVLSHANVISVAAGVAHDLTGMVTAEDVYLAYLPLAHIMEMAAEISFMALGSGLGFGTPHTLTDSGVKLKRPESQGDAAVLEPTFMVFAPAVLDKVYQGVQAKREALSGLGQMLFRWGLENGEKHFDKGEVGANAIYNGLIFKKVQRLVGGRLKGIITGSAPLSPDIQKYVQTVLNCPVRQGYGLTETCAGSCVAFWGDNSVCSVGPPTVSAKIRLADWPEGNYLNSDKDKEGIGMRRGEVLIGGPAVSLGYFINPSNPNPDLAKKNKEDWVEVGGERFFRTGDVGQIRDNGTLQIIDRKKDLWKGPNGEYVALTKVEAALTNDPFVEKPMVYGKTGGDFPIALICPMKRKIEELATQLGVTGSFAELCQNDQIVAKVSESCKKTCKDAKCVAFEIPSKYALISELWTPENDMLTAAMKMKRPQIVEKHKADIDKLYA